RAARAGVRTRRRSCSRGTETACSCTRRRAARPRIRTGISTSSPIRAWSSRSETSATTRSRRRSRARNATASSRRRPSAGRSSASIRRRRAGSSRSSRSPAPETGRSRLVTAPPRDAGTPHWPACSLKAASIRGIGNRSGGSDGQSRSAHHLQRASPYDDDAAAGGGGVMGRTLRTLAFLLAAVPIGALALGVLIAGWVAVAVLAITPLVVPALVAFRAAVGGVARLDGEIANGLLETSVRPPLRSAGSRGFWHA